MNREIKEYWVIMDKPKNITRTEFKNLKGKSKNKIIEVGYTTLGNNIFKNYFSISVYEGLTDISCCLGSFKDIQDYLKNYGLTIKRSGNKLILK